MALPLYLAMTAAEMEENTHFPPHLAYMACHFSPYGTGLSNIPKTLPPGSMLILNDRTPIHGHDPQLIASQLEDAISAWNLSGILLDFQRPGCEASAQLARLFAAALPCPVGISDLYAKDLNCAVFLPPVMPDTLLSEHLVPWHGRDIWLDISTEGLEITLTEQGAQIIALPQYSDSQDSHADEALPCHYRIELEKTSRFTLFRTEQDLQDLLVEAKHLGISRAVGLYQEWNG